MPITAWTSITLGGYNLLIDPDTLSLSDNPLVSVEKSMGGSTFVSYYKSNTPGSVRSLTINGSAITAASVAGLLAASRAKTVVALAGAPMGDGNYIIVGMSENPLKPRPNFPGSTDGVDVFYSYNISLVEVG